MTASRIYKCVVIVIAQMLH